MQLMTLKAKSPEVVTQDRKGRIGVGHMQTRSGEMLRQSRSESGGGELSAIATDGTRKQIPGR